MLQHSPLKNIFLFMILAIRTKQYAVSKGLSLIFPQPGDLDNTSFIDRTAYVSFPIKLLSERAKGKQVVL